MPIKLILTAGLSVLLAYTLVQRSAPRVVKPLMVVILGAGVYFVWFPDQTTALAGWLGVGRGTDLLMYLWILATLGVALNLSFKIRSTRREITELARAVALLTAREPDGAGGVAGEGPEEGAGTSGDRREGQV